MCRTGSTAFFCHILFVYATEHGEMHVLTGKLLRDLRVVNSSLTEAGSRRMFTHRTGST
ncbi:hypothetical protein NXC14_PC00496 (plasmid) [Rhizobium sp. NXC14]|nr:hypothetical protein NXC14_PC00496 [Rhizobium sp. NXC14]